MVDHLFDTYPLQCLHWRAAVGNWASRRVAWRCGFRVEGTVRHFVRLAGCRPVDAWVASLHREDPREPRAEADPPAPPPSRTPQPPREQPPLPG